MITEFHKITRIHPRKIHAIIKHVRWIKENSIPQLKKNLARLKEKNAKNMILCYLTSLKFWHKSS